MEKTIYPKVTIQVEKGNKCGQNPSCPMVNFVPRYNKERKLRAIAVCILYGEIGEFDNTEGNLFRHKDCIKDQKIFPELIPKT